MNQITLFGEEIKKELKFKVDKYKRVVSNAECGPTPPGEVVIRSAFCNLRCVPCFAYNYSWPEKAKNNREIREISVEGLINEFRTFFQNVPIPGNKTSYNWFRVLGGEPFLNKQTLRSYIRFLSEIPDDLASKFNKSILIQTNGIVLGSLDDNELKEIFKPIRDKPFSVVIEISIKGSNPKEFSIITQTSENIAEKYYIAHLEACKKIENIERYIPNIKWTAVAGFGIGVTNLVSGNFKRKEYIKTFYHPDTNRPFYHPDCWDNLFKEIYSLHIEKYRNVFGDKFPMFGIEDRYNWKFALVGLKNCRKYAPNYFYDGFQIYKKHVGNPNSELEMYLKDIISKFFFGDPTYYYTNLFKGELK